MISAPVRKALWTTLVVVLFGVAWRFLGAAVDPGLGSWAVVAIAPLVGLFIYRRETGQVPIPPVAMVVLGGGLLLFWILSIALGRLPITSRVDWLYAAFIVAIPAFLLFSGVRSYRRHTRTGKMGREGP